MIRLKEYQWIKGDKSTGILCVGKEIVWSYFNSEE